MERIWAGCVFSGLLLAGCAGVDQGSHGPWSEWTSVPNSHAQRFQLWVRGGERLLLVFGHGGGTDTVGRYWLADPMTHGKCPVAAERIDVPLGRVAMLSTTHVPFVSALGRTPAVVAGAHLDQVRDPALLELVGQGKVQEVAMGDGVDREKLLTLKLDALFAYPFGQMGGGAIAKLGVPVIEVSEYLEEHPLGRAEWLRFFGVLLGDEAKADSLFNGIRERYEALRVDTSAMDRPTVLFGSVWDGQWWVPPGNSYMARLIEDAGGRYVFADRKGDGNIAIDMETMVTVGAEADFWGMVANVPGVVNEGTFTNNDSRLMGFKAVVDQHCFIGNTAEQDLFGQALIEPDIMLRSMVFCLFDVDTRRSCKEPPLRPYLWPLRALKTGDGDQ